MGAHKLTSTIKASLVTAIYLGQEIKNPNLQSTPNLQLWTSSKTQHPSSVAASSKASKATPLAPAAPKSTPHNRAAVVAAAAEASLVVLVTSSTRQQEAERSPRRMRTT